MPRKTRKECPHCERAWSTAHAVSVCGTREIQARHTLKARLQDVERMHGQGRDHTSGEACNRLDNGGREGVGRGPAISRRDYPGHNNNEEDLLGICILDERDVSVDTTSTT